MTPLATPGKHHERRGCPRRPWDVSITRCWPLGLDKHPDKTFIGRIERGFDFLGYHFRPDRLSVAAKTIENFLARAIRLYEQEPGEPCDFSRLGAYVKHWAAWAKGGLVEEATH